MHLQEENEEEKEEEEEEDARTRAKKLWDELIFLTLEIFLDLESSFWPGIEILTSSFVRGAFNTKSITTCNYTLDHSLTWGFSQSPATPFPLQGPVFYLLYYTYTDLAIQSITFSYDSAQIPVRRNQAHDTSKLVVIFDLLTDYLKSYLHQNAFLYRQRPPAATDNGDGGPPRYSHLPATCRLCLLTSTHPSLLCRQFDGRTNQKTDLT